MMISHKNLKKICSNYEKLSCKISENLSEKMYTLFRYAGNLAQHRRVRRGAQLRQERALARVHVVLRLRRGLGGYLGCV